MPDWDFLATSKSPFYKESHHDKYKRGKQSVKVDFKIPETAYNDLMKYFKANGKSKTEGFEEMVWKKLETINTFRQKCFNNIEFIMLIPKTDDIAELTDKSRVIALYNTDCDFVDGFNYEYGGFDKSFNYQYDLSQFGKGFFGMEMLILNSTKETSVRNGRVTLGDLTDWDSFFARLEEIGKEEEWDLNLRDCYFVRCPLNNYLDVNRDGQFQSPNRNGDHKAIYVFNDFKKSLFCIIDWRYTQSSLGNGDISFYTYFVPMGEFIKILSESNYKPLRDSIADINNSEYNKRALEVLIDGQEKWLELLKATYEKF